MRQIARLLPIVTALVGGVWLVGASAAATPLVLEGDGVIDLILDSPPSIADSIDLRLVRTDDDSTDVTDTACGPLEVSSPSPLPSRRCTGLDDGSYFVSVTGAPPGAAVPTPRRCVAPLDAQDESGSVQISTNNREWNCTVTVSLPGVVIDLAPASGSGASVPVYDIEVLNPDGQVVSSDCELDGRLDEFAPRRWCAPLELNDFDEYTTRPLGIPDGVTAVSRCARVSSVANNFGPSFLLDDEDQPPFFRCSGAQSVPSLTLRIEWEGSNAVPLDPAWVEAVTYLVTDDTGIDVTENCRRTDVLRQNISDTTIDCFALEVGAYQVAVSGLRDDFEFNNDCQEIVVDEDGGSCDFIVIYDTVVLEPTTAPTTAPTPDPDMTNLPETGSATPNLALIALTLFGAGIGLAVLSRRRTL